MIGKNVGKLFSRAVGKEGAAIPVWDGCFFFVSIMLETDTCCLLFWDKQCCR